MKYEGIYRTTTDEFMDLSNSRDSQVQPWWRTCHAKRRFVLQYCILPWFYENLCRQLCQRFFANATGRMGQEQSGELPHAGGRAYEGKPVVNPEGAYQFKLEPSVDLPEQKNIDWDRHVDKL